MHVAINGMLLGVPHFSGVEHAILDLTNAVAKLTHVIDDLKVTFFVPQERDGFPPETERFRLSKPRHPPSNRLARMLWEQVRLPRQVNACQCDVLHSPGYISPRAGGRPIVLTVYDLIAMEHPEWCRTTNRLNYRFWLPISLHRARMIIAPSTATATRIAARWPHLEPRIRRIPLAPKDTYRKESAQTLPRPIPDPYVLFVGNHEPKKNVDTLVRAFTRFVRTTKHPHRLVIAGGPGWGTQSLETLIAAEGIADRVTIQGYVPQADLPAYYAHAAAFVFPSLYEGFGLPVLEAMAAGTPVVCSACGALEEVAGKAARFVEPHDTAAIAAALDSILANPELRQSMIANGLRQSARFTWQHTAEQTVAIYREALM